MPDTGPDDPDSILGVTQRLSSTDTLLQKFSYAKAWLDPIRVVGVYSGPVEGCVAPFASGNSAAIVRYALGRADPDVDYRSVNRTIIMMAPDLASTCDINPNGSFYPQLDTADGPYSGGVLIYPTIDFAAPWASDRVLAHEFVHTLGAGHVTTLTCYDTPAQANRVPYSYIPGVQNGFPAADLCPGWYMSPIDLMGSPNNEWSNIDGPLKKQFGWIGPANVVTTREGTYTLRPLDASASPNGTLMVQIPVAYTTNQYTLEYRTEGPFPGVYLFLSYPSSPGSVVPFQLSVAPYFFQPLALGTSAIDAAMGLSVDVLAYDADGATITISSDASYVTQCNDGVWNGTGYGFNSIDAADFSCRTGAGLSELEPAPQCYDGIDNDRDGRTDTQDPVCFSGDVFNPQANQE